MGTFDSQAEMYRRRAQAFGARAIEKVQQGGDHAGHYATIAGHFALHVMGRQALEREAALATRLSHLAEQLDRNGGSFAASLIWDVLEEEGL